MVMFSGSSTPTHELFSPARLAALEALGEGWNFNDSAAVAGVNRTTLYRWIQNDPEFRSAYTLGQQTAREAARSELVAGAEASVSRVKELMETDCKFAIKVMKELGWFKPAAAAEAQVKDARQEIELEAMERDYHVEQRLAKLASRHEAKLNRAAEVNEDLTAGKGERAKRESQPKASASQAQAKTVAADREPVEPVCTSATEGSGNQNHVGNRTMPIATAVAPVLPANGKNWTFEDALAIVGLEKRPDPAASAMLTGYLSQLTQAAAQSGGSGLGRR